MATTCSNSYLSPEERLKSIFTIDEEGNVAIRTITVTGGELDALLCDDTRSFIELLASAIGTDSVTGKPALRLSTS